MDSIFKVTAPWPLSQKIALRFFLIFFVFFMICDPNAGVPLADTIYDYYIAPLKSLTIWAGAHIFHLAKPVIYQETGSGDTTHDYIMMFFVFVFAAVGTAIWTVIERKPRNYDRLYYWLMVMVRFYLGITMVSYGAVKIVKLQFPDPSLFRLLEAYGNSSPMALAWTFMGYSKGYNYFTGLAELSCGVLLLFRRTTTLGALIALVVSANIMAINYSFDVPVKIVSTMMVLMSGFILFKDFHRFLNFFFLNKTAEPANLSAKRFEKKWKNVILLVVKILILLYVAASNIMNGVEGYKLYGQGAKKPPLFGIYNTVTFTRNNIVIPPITTDTTRWKKIIVSGEGYARVILMNDSIRHYTFKADTSAKLITMNTPEDTLQKFVFKYQMQKPDKLIMIGMIRSDSLKMVFTRFDEKDFLLKKRGYHWINETGFNK